MPAGRGDGWSPWGPLEWKPCWPPGWGAPDHLDRPPTRRITPRARTSGGGDGDFLMALVDLVALLLVLVTIVLIIDRQGEATAVTAAATLGSLMLRTWWQFRRR